MVTLGEPSVNRLIVSHQITPEQVNPIQQTSAVRNYAATLQEAYNQAMYQAAFLESQEQPQFLTPQYQEQPTQSFSARQLIQQTTTQYQEQPAQSFSARQPIQQTTV